MKIIWLLVIIVLGMVIWGRMTLNIRRIQTQHFEDRKMPVEFLVVHSFALTVPEMIEKLDHMEVSTHYMIDTKGTIYQLVPDDKVAWHAGKSFWRGKEKLNASSIGIELQNETLGQTDFTPKQLSAFVKLAKRLIRKYHIPPKNVVSHSDIAPERKVDVGRHFPWKKMAEEGIGLWGNNTIQQPADEKDVQKLLSKIGYDTTNEKAAVLAFMRRFTPELVSLDAEINKLEENLPAWIQTVDLKNTTFLLRLNQVASVYPEWTGTK